ncbi:MAG: DUF2442 domain-containing protein [Bacteroidetes bacterium]|nr:DUF2442 domain-containing protein [Bacteroidota bacterium]
MNDIKIVEVINDIVFLLIVDNVYRHKWVSLSKKLAAASKEEKEKLTISLSGLGIHWNLIDGNISIKKLLDSGMSEL